jgi:methionyl-tRNA synthetase
VPDYRWNEIRGFLRQPLNDLCISRPKIRLSWGIPLPFDQDYVTYVWFDALLNYVSASTAFHKTYADGTPIWPATYHLIGKDILTTHSVYWPTMLMALDIPLPQHILAHGWWLVNGGEKMSKSAGNVVNPMDYMEKYGIDAFRYFLAREMVVGQDANFTHDGFVRRINSDLANDLGNVLNRVHRLVLNNFEGKLPAATAIGDAEKEVIDLANKVIEEIKEGLPQARLSQSIETIMQLVRSINRYLEIKAPWKLAKDPALKDELATVLYVSAEAVRLSLCLLWPVIPGKAEEGLAMIGSKFQSADDLAWGILKGGETFGEGKPLFPRIEEEVKKQEAQPKPKQNKPLMAADVPAAMDMRVAQIKEVADHPDATSLYVLKVDAGEGELRTICSGLKSSYKAEELQDRKILLFANLKPSALRGIMSQGMLFAGDLDAEAHTCRLVSVPDDAKPGDRALFKGVAPSEPRELKVKDFEKIALSVKGGAVFCDALALEVNGKPVTCDVADGNGVH